MNILKILCIVFFPVFLYSCGVKGPPESPLVTAPELEPVNQNKKRDPKKLEEPPPPTQTKKDKFNVE